MHQDKTKSIIYANLTDIFTEHNTQGSHVGTRLVNTIKSTQRALKPPFPKQIQVETTNICNHACSFCAYTLMERTKGQMKPELFKRLVKEAYDNGAREIGLFAGAEPLTCKWLDEYVHYCKTIGYEYMYISTNGSIPNQDRFKQIIDAGLNSIKFSVNGGNREIYKKVHGNDHFDRVISNIRFVSDYRKKVEHKVYIGVSFVGMEMSKNSYSELQELIRDYVDEIIYYEASNQSGQMNHLPLPPYRDCHLPFNKLHISREGYLKACCNDYENLLAIEDLNKMSMLEAWNGEKFQDLREKHLNNKMDGTLCANCIRASKVKPKPINPKLTESKIPEALTKEN
ncbi:TPA: radical SAM protein [Legionella pneumophila]|nr:radical SAM protein [Legionella pneumophila serogroup 13]HAT7074271.1 radical SAM protein [Legionella pneumophila]HAT8869545.1 radical SAM protein [Legionella pneumophila subsp. pneumophila]HAT8934752.1 radical SAM protein [Legionella pneumophila subsp. pneumophila]HAU0163820.1 radical SAM protein [Legionella pneumophila]